MAALSCMLTANSRTAFVGVRSTRHAPQKLSRSPWKCVQCAASITFSREGDSVTIDKVCRHVLCHAVAYVALRLCLFRWPQDVIVVGSSPQADLQVEDASVAAEHARLERRAARVYLLALLGDEEDLHSTSGEAAGDHVSLSTLARQHRLCPSRYSAQLAPHSAPEAGRLLAAGTCLEGTQLRRGVAYLLAPGASVRFGDTEWTLDFQEQQGNSAAAEALFQGMLAGASDEVRNALKD